MAFLLQCHFFQNLRLQLPSSVAKTYQQFCDRQRLYPLLMRLRPEFLSEPLRAWLLYRDPVPRLDTALSELIAEETRLRTLATHRASPADLCLLLSWLVDLLNTRDLALLSNEKQSFSASQRL